MRSRRRWAATRWCARRRWSCARAPPATTRRLVAYVAPGLPDEASGGADRASEQVAQWRAVWEETYGGRDAAFDTVGWDSSYTGLPLPDDDMREWLDHTVGRILALKPARLLEVGCGSGLLLFRVAPHCQHYTATDFSEQAVRSAPGESGRPAWSRRSRPSISVRGRRMISPAYRRATSTRWS